MMQMTKTERRISGSGVKRHIKICGRRELQLVLGAEILPWWLTTGRKRVVCDEVAQIG